MKGVVRKERDVGMSSEISKIEDTRQEERGGNECSHQGDLNGASRLPARGGVWKEDARLRF